VDTSDTDAILSKVILVPTNEETTAINDQIVSRQAGESVTYTSIDSIVCEDGEDPTEFPEEFLYTQTPNGLPPHKLTLKVGTVVMLLRNLDVKHGLCNGSRLIIRQLQNYVLDCEVLTGSSKGQRVLIPRIKLKPTGSMLPFVFERLQFPVRIAFAMTINKAQGQTFKHVGLVLLSPVFSHGQLYVGFSRVRNFESIRVVLPAGKTSTKNVVYKEIL
jgi:ATP-dependent DNA helicase PIF1